MALLPNPVSHLWAPMVAVAIVRVVSALALKDDEARRLRRIINSNSVMIPAIAEFNHSIPGSGPFGHPMLRPADHLLMRDTPVSKAMRTKRIPTCSLLLQGGNWIALLLCWAARLEL